ncbi:MAG TPA: GNAT family N-acetyltransferase [Armatimonadota bacterium]|jgi:hypothetical protein
MKLMVRELADEEMKLWDTLEEVSPQRSIFTQRWWADIVTHGGVRYLGCFDGEQLMGALPIWPCVTLGVPRLRQPALTPHWGPLLMPLGGKTAACGSGEAEILRALAKALTPWPDIALAFHPSLTNCLPFYWHGFRETTRYTYRIDNLAENLPRGSAIHRAVRSGLQRARVHGLTIREGVAPEIVAEMSSMSMARQHMDSSADIREFWTRLYRAAQEHGCATNCAAVDSAGEVHSAFAIVWDDRYAYDLLGGGDPQYRQSNAGTFVVQHLLEMGMQVAPSFDFEGSMLETVGQFFRQFGGTLTPYHLLVRNESPRLNIARTVQNWLKSHRRRRPALDGA